MPRGGSRSSSTSRPPFPPFLVRRCLGPNRIAGAGRRRQESGCRAGRVDFVDGVSYSQLGFSSDVPDGLMFRACLSFLLAALLLLPSGVCVCGACAHERESVAGEDGPPCPGPCGDHAGSGPADHPDQHAPGCPALDPVVRQAVPVQGKLLSAVPFGGPSLLATSLAVPSASAFPSARSVRPFLPGRPLFVVLRELRI